MEKDNTQKKNVVIYLEIVYEHKKNVVIYLERVYEHPNQTKLRSSMRCTCEATISDPL